MAALGARPRSACDEWPPSGAFDQIADGQSRGLTIGAAELAERLTSRVLLLHGTFRSDPVDGLSGDRGNVIEVSVVVQD